MDALTHAIEWYITKGAWEMTDMMHLKASEIVGLGIDHSMAHTLNAFCDGGCMPSG